MDIEAARKLGFFSALKSVTVGLVVAYLIIVCLVSGDGIVKALLWISDFDYSLNLAVAVISIYLCAYFLGQRAGVEILIKYKEYAWVGIKYGFLTLLLSTFFSSWVGFFQAVAVDNGTNKDLVADYILKPIFLIFLVGCLPTVFIGWWFGYQIKRNGKSR